MEKGLVHFRSSKHQQLLLSSERASWMALNYSFVLSMVCRHILRFPLHCDVASSWEGRVHVATGFLCSTEENNQNISLGRECRQQGMCKAMLLLPSASAWGPSLVLFDHCIYWSSIKAHTPFWKLFVFFLPHPGELMVPYICFFKLS